jgi:hypothetical protein
VPIATAEKRGGVGISQRDRVDELRNLADALEGGAAELDDLVFGSHRRGDSVTVFYVRRT